MTRGIHSSRSAQIVAALFLLLLSSCGPSVQRTEALVSSPSVEAGVVEAGVVEVGVETASAEDNPVTQSPVSQNPQNPVTRDDGATPQTDIAAGATVVHPTPYGRPPNSDGNARPPRIVQRNVTVGPSYDRAIIQRVVRRHLPTIRGCYDRVIAEHPGVAGSLRARFTITVEGSTDDVEITTPLHPKLDPCVASAIATWRFPRPDYGRITVVYPFVFAPPGATTTSRSTTAPASAAQTPSPLTEPTIFGALDRDEIRTDPELAGFSASRR